MTQNLALMTDEEHYMMGSSIDAFPKKIISQVARYAVKLDNGYMIAKNYSQLNIKLDLLDKELSRADFFDTGSVKNGYHLKTNGIYCFKNETHHGAIVYIGDQCRIVHQVKRVLDLHSKHPWSMFDDRFWFTTEEDAKMAYLVA